MREIEIVFTKSKKPFPIISWLIRWWTGKDYSHVARRMKISFLDEPNYWQASEGKVNWEYHTHFMKKHEIVKVLKFPVTEEERRAFNKACWEEVGGKYGLMQNVGIFLVDIAEMLGIKMKNPWRKYMNCSEALYKVILSKKYPDLDYNPDTIKPHHIEEIWLKCCA